ncbi:MAG: TonB-dependent siderophore receptor [Fluviicola sp.]|nr:TonB-dependent siderophore receptor [Fluviicola sp.]
MNWKHLLLTVLVCMLGKHINAQTGNAVITIKSTEQEKIENCEFLIDQIKIVPSSQHQNQYTFLNLSAGTHNLIITALSHEKKQLRLTIEPNETSRLTVELNFQDNLVDEVIINGERSNIYYNDSNFTVGKLPLKDLENPQVYNSISKELLQDQVATDMNDALKNATGITRLWESTGRGGDGGEFYSMRGFSVQPTMINGLPSQNMGVVDPANVESIEVIKGPSGTLFGSPMISYGGLINVTTKKPYDRLGGNFGFVTGNFGLNRLTADINTPLGKRTAVRLNAAYHTQQTFQDAGFKKSIYFAPSFKFQASKRLTFLINTEFLSAESANAPMIFLNRYAPLTFNSIDLFERNYKRSFTSNDLSIKNPTFSVQSQALYKLAKNWTSKTVVSSSTTQTDGYYSYLWDMSDGDSFYRYSSKRKGETQTTDIQQNFIGDFQLGKMRNRLVVGLDYYQSDIRNSSSGWVGNGIVKLSDGSDSGKLTQVGLDSLLTNSFEGISTAQNRIMSAYFSDVINILPSLSAMVSLRLDHFSGRVAYWTTDVIKNQVALSPKFGLVYQPVKDKVSIFGNYMNGFVNQAPVQVSDADGSNVRMQTLEPEQANQLEGGVKTHLFNGKLAFTGSYYHILVSNKVMTDPTNVNGIIQGGEVTSQGLEFSAIANPIKGLNIVAGYSLNEAKVTKDDPANGYLGLRPEEAGPSQLVNYWLSYTIPGSKLKGLGLGFGGNAASEHLALNRATTGTFTLPAYHIMNASIYFKTPTFTVTCKLDNIMNQRYYSGWSGVIAQQPRSISLSLNYQF